MTIDYQSNAAVAWGPKVNLEGGLQTRIEESRQVTERYAAAVVLQGFGYCLIWIIGRNGTDCAKAYRNGFASSRQPTKRLRQPKTRKARSPSQHPFS